MALVDQNGIPLPIVRIEKQKSWKRLFFAPLGLVGCYLLYVPWAYGVTPGEPGTPIHGPFDSGAAFGVTVLLTLLGLAMAGPAVFFGLHREGFDFTTDGTQLARWWGVGIPLRFSKETRAHYGQVVLEKKVKRSDQKGRHTWFDVLFGGDKGRTWIASFHTYRQARQRAEAIAKRLEMALRDEGQHEPFTRQHDELDVPVREQAGRFVPRSLPQQPVGSSVQFHETDECAEVRIPAPGLRGPRLLRALIGGAVAFLIWAIFLYPDNAWADWAASDDAIEAFAGVWLPRLFWALTLIPLGWLVVPSLWRSLGRDRLEIYSDRLRIHRAMPLSLRGFELDASEIEEIITAPRESDWNRDPKAREYVVSVRSDDGFVELGAGLTDRERDWLRDLLLYYLAR
ncbi:MAG: hypothetical protein ACYTGX_12185 [Planctomycetota bacterium]|jgi:hypothetical protein